MRPVCQFETPYILHENNLIILGPKINNDIGIKYNYKNNEKEYIDPEKVNIKSKTINQVNNKEIDGMTLQIYHSEININDHRGGYNTSAGQRLASRCPEKNTHSQNVRKSIETKEVHVEADKRHSKQQVAFPHRRR